MNKDVFIEACCNSGYCTKAVARKYVSKNPKDFYDENDFAEAYRLVNQLSGKRIPHQKGIIGGKTTAYDHRGGSSSAGQDWEYNL